MCSCISYDTPVIRKWQPFSNRGIHCAVWIECLNTCACQFESSLLRVNHFCFAIDKGYLYSASDSTWHWSAFFTLWTPAVDVRRFTLRPFCSLRKSHWFPLRIMNGRPRSYLDVDSKTKLTLWRRNFFFILAHSVYKMWIIQEPNKLALWNKLHFEEKKTESIEHV